MIKFIWDRVNEKLKMKQRDESSQNTGEVKQWIPNRAFPPCQHRVNSTGIIVISDGFCLKMTWKGFKKKAFLLYNVS